MDLLTAFGLFIILYFCIYAIALALIDCDLELAIAEKFGKKIDSLKGKVIWVTGASSGIGEAIAMTVAKGGAKLVLSARRIEELKRVKKNCLNIGGCLSDEDILILQMDVTAVETHQQLLNQVIRHFGKLDILVNNAGRSQRAHWEEIDLTVDREMFDVNVFGMLSLSRLVVKYFQEVGQGHIAVTSSIAGIMPVPFSATYLGTKHSIHGYFNGLRMEKCGKNFHVTLLCPGPVFTNFLAESFTSKSGEKFGKPVSPTDKRMTAERCGQLCAIAIANKLHESWMALFPIIPLCYLIYYPNLGKLIFKFLGNKGLMKLRDSKQSVQSK